MNLFTPFDAIEETWRIVQPLLDEAGQVFPYQPGSWGPAEADRLVKGVCTWAEPWRPVEQPGEGMLLGG
jgi:glucose-6-phosphate 1-dehydrogenase